MELTQQLYTHMTNKNQYSIELAEGEDTVVIRMTEKYTLAQWKARFNKQELVQISRKTGYELQGAKFVDVLRKALSQREIDCYVDVLTKEDLQNLKNRKNGGGKKTAQKSSANALTKRYLILTYMANENKFHYPLSLSADKLELHLDKLKQIYNSLRTDLEAARASALNDTQKSDSFSINYNNEKNRNNKNLNQASRAKEIDQVKSENEILKAKLARLEEQVGKKKANIEIEAAIERTRQLREAIETGNMELVDWKNSIQNQEETNAELKKELASLHRKICSLLQSDKELAARKKGEEVEKELNQVKNNIKKNTTEIDKLKKDLQNSKARVKELQIKAKKLNSEKQVIRKGKRGPYSSAGSVRSFGSYNSFNSAGKRSTGSNMSGSSKAKSNYSSNSYSYNRRR